MTETIEYISHIIRGIIRMPEELRVEHVAGDFGDALEIHVARNDMGRILGRQGETIKSIHRLMHAFYGGREFKPMIRLIEPA